MTTFKQIASSCFFDDDDHTDTLHIDKKIQQGKKYKTTGELDLEKAKEIDNDQQKTAGAAEHKITAKQSKNKELKDLVDNLRSELKKKDEQIQELKSRLTEDNQDIEHLIADYDNLNRYCDQQAEAYAMTIRQRDEARLQLKQERDLRAQDRDKGIFKFRSWFYGRRK